MKNLLSATKIVLLIMTVAFVWLTVIGIVDSKDYTNAFFMVLSFYFGQKYNKTPNPQ